MGAGHVKLERCSLKSSRQLDGRRLESGERSRLKMKNRELFTMVGC